MVTVNPIDTTSLISKVLVGLDLGIGLVILIFLAFGSYEVVLFMSLIASVLLLAQGGMMFMGMRKQGNPAQQQPAAAGQMPSTAYGDATGTAQPQPSIRTATKITCANCGKQMSKIFLKDGTLQLLCNNCGREILVDENEKHNVVNGGDQNKNASLGSTLKRIGAGVANTDIVDMDSARQGTSPHLSNAGQQPAGRRKPSTSD